MCVFASLVVRVELTIRCFHPRFLSSFPGARGPPLSRHLIPIRGCAAHRLELSEDGGSPWCRLVWAGAFPASFREGLGIDLGGDGKQVFALPGAWGMAIARAWNCGSTRRAEGLRWWTLLWNFALCYGGGLPSSRNRLAVSSTGIIAE